MVYFIKRIAQSSHEFRPCSYQFELSTSLETWPVAAKGSNFMHLNVLDFVRETNRAAQNGGRLYAI